MSEIKTCFTSRWEGGLLFEADFSQLEIFGLALLSGDEVLKSDLLSGRDLHRMRAAELYSIPESAVTPAQRKLAKMLSFQLQYGAGANSMAATNGVTKKFAEDFIKLYYERYKRVKQWQEEVYTEVRSSRKATSTHTARGFPRGKGTHTSSTGRRYTFLESDSEYGPEPNFSPTEVKNYPVQGYATADIMAVFRHMVYREWLGWVGRGCYLPINTVHDSIMFDVSSSMNAFILKERLEEIVRQLPRKLEDLWGQKIDLPLAIECKAGPTWATMEKLS